MWSETIHKCWFMGSNVPQQAANHLDNEQPTHLFWYDQNVGNWVHIGGTFRNDIIKSMYLTLMSPDSSIH